MDIDESESYHSTDFGTEGFDLHAGKSWIYPTNYPMREYQYRIVQEALYQNTLVRKYFNGKVSLPTGLGKTFIASVVMYNFYRWYPSGKVIFMAPTRPLVKQQIDACYDIMAIPQNVTAELTGTKAQTSREEIWRTKRVFFITPQVLQNDIETFPELAKQIKCLVFDEAHKARGNHSYCEVIRKLIVHTKHFRVLALSATPGNSTNDVIDVSMNLLISHLEVRTEESPDVAPYVFHRTLKTVVVPLGGKLEEMRNKYLKVLERYVKVLKDHKIITGNCANLTKGKIFMTLKDFNLRAKYQRHPNHSDISRTLSICVTLYHGYELLIRHGMRGFLNFFEEHSKKSLLEGNSQLFAIMDEMQKYIGPRPEVSLLPDGTIPQIETNSKFGHPKFYKLRNILLEYYGNDDNKESKVIIFSEFKETVMEAYAMLMQHSPIIRPKYFMGQGAITQKQQISIIKSFKEGRCNVLISTCIGEEGLDIGEVDLIICFDISNKSPIRLIQRMGRTGRKKQGKVIILVTEGKEQDLLREALANKSNLSTYILKSDEIPKHLYKNNPRMIPEDIFPTCNKIYISVPKVVKSKTGNIKDMFNNLNKNESASQILKDVEEIESEELIPTSTTLWNQSEPLSDDLVISGCNKRLDSLRIYQPFVKIGHSLDTDILVSLLKFSDAKRYNLPFTQSSTTGLSQTSNKKGKITRSESSDNFKQTDIRNLFIKSKPTSHEVVNENISQETSQETLKTTIENIKKKQIESLTNDLFSEISLYLNICSEEKISCVFCEKTSLCNRLPKPKELEFNISDWIQPDFSIIENLTEKDFDEYLQDLTIKESLDNLTEIDFDHFSDDNFSIFEVNEESFRFETPKKENTFRFEPPKSIKKVIGNSELSINLEESFQMEKESFPFETPKKENKIRFEASKSTNKVIKHSEFINLEETFKMKEESFRFETPKKENTFGFEPPKSIKKVIGNSELSTNLKQFKINEENVSFETPKKENTIKFETSSIKKVFENSNLEKSKKKSKIQKDKDEKIFNITKKIFNEDEIFNFFELNHIEEIFNTDDFLNCKDFDKSSLLFDESQSPIISSQIPYEIIPEDRSLSSPVLSSSIKEIIVETPKKINNQSLKSKLESVKKSDFYISKQKRIENDDKNDNTKIENIYFEEDRKSSLSNYSEDLFDSPTNSPQRSNLNSKPLESLNLNKSLLKLKDKSPLLKENKIEHQELNLSDICDESFFGLNQEIDNKLLNKSGNIKIKNNESGNVKNKESLKTNHDLRRKSEDVDFDDIDESVFDLTHEVKQLENKSSKNINVNRVNQEIKTVTEGKLSLCKENLDKNDRNNKNKLLNQSGNVKNVKELQIDDELKRDLEDIDFDFDGISDEELFCLSQKANELERKSNELEKKSNENVIKSKQNREIKPTTTRSLSVFKGHLDKNHQNDKNQVSNETKNVKNIKVSQTDDKLKRQLEDIDLDFDDMCDESLFCLSQKANEVEKKSDGNVIKSKQNQEIKSTTTRNLSVFKGNLGKKDRNNKNKPFNQIENVKNIKLSQNDDELKRQLEDIDLGDISDEELFCLTQKATELGQKSNENVIKSKQNQEIKPKTTRNISVFKGNLDKKDRNNRNKPFNQIENVKNIKLSQNDDELKRQLEDIDLGDISDEELFCLTQKATELGQKSNENVIKSKQNREIKSTITRNLTTFKGNLEKKDRNNKNELSNETEDVKNVKASQNDDELKIQLEDIDLDAISDEELFCLTQKATELGQKSNENVIKSKQNREIKPTTTRNLSVSKENLDKNVQKDKNKLLNQTENVKNIKVSQTDDKLKKQLEDIDLDFDDICDESLFGLTQKAIELAKKSNENVTKSKQNQEIKPTTTRNLSISKENFGKNVQKDKNQLLNETKNVKNIKVLQTDNKLRKKLEDIDLDFDDICDEELFCLTQKAIELEKKSNENVIKSKQNREMKPTTTRNLSVFKGNLDKNHQIDKNQVSNETENVKNIKVLQTNNEPRRKLEHIDLNFDDICDESLFGLTQEAKQLEKTSNENINLNKQNSEMKTATKRKLSTPKYNFNKNNRNDKNHDLKDKSKDFDLSSDIFDESLFGLTQDIKQIENKLSENQNATKQNQEIKSVAKRKLPDFKEDLDRNSKIKKHQTNVDLTISDLCDESFFGLPKEKEKLLNLPPFIKKCSPSTSKQVITIEDSPIKNNLNDSYSDSSLSPVLDYTSKNTQRNSAKKSQNQKIKSQNQKMKSPDLLLNDLCDPSIFDLDTDLQDTKNDELSPVLTQKCKKPNLSKLKTQRKIDFSTDFGDPKKVQSMFNCDFNKNESPVKINDTSGVTITQVIDMINKPNEPQSNKPKTIKLDLLDDDNAFENFSYKTPVKANTTKKLTLKTPKSTQKVQERSFSNSDDEFQIPSVSHKKKEVGLISTKINLALNRKKRKKKLKNPYIDDEAVVSSDEHATDDTSDSGGTQDCFDASFITQRDIANTTMMHVKYLESVRSPLHQNGRFKIPDLPRNDIMDVFSQKENISDNTYLEDSFCVDIADSQIVVENDLSELEIAERRLEEYRKYKHRHKEKEKIIKSKKKRRIITLSSDSE